MTKCLRGSGDIALAERKQFVGAVPPIGPQLLRHGIDSYLRKPPAGRFETPETVFVSFGGTWMNVAGRSSPGHSISGREGRWEIRTHQPSTLQNFAGRLNRQLSSANFGTC